MLLHVFAQAGDILLLKGRTWKFCSSRQASEILEGKVSLPELTCESLKGRHPAAARRKRALWRGGERHIQEPKQEMEDPLGQESRRDLIILAM